MLGVPVDQIDILKYIRQLRAIVKWKRNPRGTIVAATGVGKTFMAYIAIAKMLKFRPNGKTVIIVPTRPLKDQWEEQIKALGLRGCEVYVVNTIALGTLRIKTDLLVIDEIHLMAADKFSLIFSHIRYDWILGLTASLERLDGRHVLLQNKAPICDTITQREAIENGWISDFIEINLPVRLTRKDKEELEALNKKVRQYMSKFGDLNTMHNCMVPENARIYAKAYYPQEDEDRMAELIKVQAIQGSRYIHMRQEFICNTEHKIAVAVELIQRLNLRTITFSQSTKYADEVVKLLGSSARAYHSNLETEILLIDKKKSYKTEKSALNFASSKSGGKVVKIGPKEFEVKWSEPKPVGAETLKKLAVKWFKEGKIHRVCTAKALDQGFDVRDAEMGVEGSRSRNPTQRIQRTGRIARNFTYKDGTKKRGIYINLYIPNSTDEKKLLESQSKSENVVTLQSIDEVISFVKKILKI
jgi:superfamily II DNA or RNA helicase